MLICVEHARALVVVENSVYWEEITRGERLGDGTSTPDLPYRIWSTDLWGCPYTFCNISIAVTAEQPIRENWQDGYERLKQSGRFMRQFHQ